MIATISVKGWGQRRPSKDYNIKKYMGIYLYE
nr:MAG TPA: hypothetical protein [Bacteriophage sp.]